MNLSAPFIHRPVGTTLLAIGLALAGILAFYLLPVAPLPAVEFPTIIVQASLPGASPETMSTSVATPLERALSRIAGITDMTSGSRLGSTRIVVQFDLSRNIDSAARDVQAAINAAASDLPANLPSRPSYRKVNPSDAPVMIIALTSDTYPMAKMYDVASTVLQQKLLQMSGVGQVVVGGSSLPAVRVELNPTQLNKYGIGFADVQTAIAASNSNSAKGQINDGSDTFQLFTNGQMLDAKSYQSLIVRYNQGNAVRLSDVADVRDSVQDIHNGGLVNGKPSVMLVIFKEPGTNIIQTVDHIHSALPALNALIPSGMHMGVVMDRTSTIRASLHNVEATLLISILLVTFVIYGFLGNFRAMLIPSIAMTLSLLGTFAVMWLLGFSLNNLSLMAVIISTGFVVDDAIVVLENVSRHIEAGMKPKAAALKGAAEIGFTVTSISISLIAVFIPILCMGGIVGRLFREFAITLSVAILISLLISLTLTPVMCAFFLQARVVKPGKPSILFRLNMGMKKFYESSLSWALDHTGLMSILALSTLVLSIALFIVIPKGFFPQQDTGRINASIVTDQDNSFQSLHQKFAYFIDVIKKDPAVENVSGFIGSSSVNSGSIFIALKPLEERKVSADEVINRLRSRLNGVSGATVYMQAAQDLLIGGRQGNAQFQYTISADNLEEVNLYGQAIRQRLMKLPGIADVNSDQRDHGLQLFVHIDYDKAARLGISARQVDTTLYSAFGQRLASVMYMPMNQYYVVLEAAPEYTQNPETLQNVYVTPTTGTAVPLSAFAEFTPSSTLLSVNHQGLAPSATISFNLLPGVPLGNAVNMVQDAVSQMNLPVSVQGAFRGTAQAFQASVRNEPYLILAALLAVYIVLGMLYESLIHPLTILSTLPAAGVGALLALLLTRIDLNLIAVIGVILLIGIVKKNAIMMIDFVLDISRREKKTAREAIYQAAVLRFRPIMMTSAAALLGAIPLALNRGMGAEMQVPLGVSIIGGLIFSQMLTLYTTPVIYLMVERLRNAFYRRGEGKTDE